MMHQDFTFRERVQEFWKWFPSESEKLTAAMRSSEPAAALDTFVESMREKIGGLCWTFGPGETSERFSLTVTGEGIKSRQLLSNFWLEHAVDVDGWDFHGSRQPSPPALLADLAIDIAGNSVDASTLMIATDVDQENEVVNIKAWHESFSDLDEHGRFQILYLLLDEAVGEFGTQTKIGTIEFISDSDARPLVELPDYLTRLWAENEWVELSPLETYSGYESTPSDEFDRADTIAGYTCLPNVVMGYMNNGGQLDGNPLADTGAELVYVSLDREHLQLEDLLEYRTGIEKELAKRLAGGGGYVTGGATGADRSYVDLIIFDSNRSYAAINEALELTHKGHFESKSFFTD